MKRFISFRWRFFFRIIFPVVAAIILFIISFYAVILPAYERSIMERKADMIRELTITAWSVLQKYHLDEFSGILSTAQAKQQAASCIESLRYGNEGKDYFWITDLKPLMVMHPYRKELNGTDLSEFKDPLGKRLFVEMAVRASASESGEGFVEYMWQWKDDSTQIVPKLSFVKFFKPWGWVIGTGIYLEDVREEIASLERGLFITALIITLILSFLMGIVTVQSFRIEQKRVLAEKEIKRSEEKYRTLVEASSDGTIMILDGEVVYANKILQDLTEFTENELVEKGLGILFRPSDLAIVQDAINKTTDDLGTAVQIEIYLSKKPGDLLLAELVVSLMPLGNDFVHVIQVKPLSDEKRKIRLQTNQATDFQTTLLFLSQPVGKFPGRLLTCDLHQSIRQAARVMTDMGYDAILVTAGDGEPVGIVTDEDIRKRAIAESVSPDRPVHAIMSSPLVTIPGKGMLFEAISLMQEREISHLGVRNQEGEIIGIVSNSDLLQVHRYSVSLIRKQVEMAETWHAVAEIGRRIPELTVAMMNTGSDVINLVRFNAILFDAIVRKFIQLAVDQLGDPPVPFVYLLLGSAGREEQTLATDQDNAILFADVNSGQFETVHSFFLRIGSTVSQWLNESGYPFCKGKIMASNPEWCQPLSRWKEKFTGWIVSSEPQDLLDINIFFDFRPVYGETRLCDDLHRHIQEVIKKHPAFFIYLTGNIQRLKPPLGFFGNIVVGSGKSQPETFDSKHSMLPLVDIARLYALKEGIRDTNTLERITQLHRLGLLSDRQLDERNEAYSLLMMIRFRHQVEQLAKGESPDNFVNPETISTVELAMLKKVFSEISEFIGQVVAEFRGGTGM